MRIRRFAGILLTLVLLVSSCVPTFADTKEYLTASTHAVRYGNNLYYAFGCDGGGSLCKYNLTSKKETVLAKGKYRYLSVKGNYIYTGKNDYTGSDHTNYNIYRMSRNGNNKKKLAKGDSPVIIGNYIYYVAYNAGKAYGKYTVDNGSKGLYRMNLDGTGKKKIYGSSDINKLMRGSSNQKIYMRYRYTGNWNYYDLSKKQVYSAEIDNHYMNVNLHYGITDRHYNKIQGGGYKYTYSGSSLYRTDINGGNKKKILTVGGSIEKVIYSNDFLFVVSHVNGQKAYVYKVRKSGAGKKLLEYFYLAGGSYDY